MAEKRTSAIRLGPVAPPALLAALALVAALVLVGTAYGLWSETIALDSVLAYGYTNADFVDAWTDDPYDPGNSPDPQWGIGVNPEDKEIAYCTAEVIDEKTIEVEIHRAYPYYACTITTVLRNEGTLPERREPLEIDNPDPEALHIEEVTPDMPRDLVLYPGEEDVELFLVGVKQEAQPISTYSFVIRKRFSLWVAGSVGFWKNWDAHNTYTKAEIEGWLIEASTSAWLEATTVDQMAAVFDAATGQGTTLGSRFRAQYLATRLNYHSGRLDPTRPHDLSGVDPGNYLGLAEPAGATLPEIIDAIEAKSGTDPSAAEFEIMKDVCDGLNNLDL